MSSLMVCLTAFSRCLSRSSCAYQPKEDRKESMWKTGQRNRFAIDEVIRNGRGGFIEHVENDRVKNDVTNGESVFEAFFLLDLQETSLYR